MKEKNSKKPLVIVLIISILIVLGIITSYIDNNRIKKNIEPKFTIKTIDKTENKITYYGLGYKVIRYVGISPNEPFKNSIGVKMGTWFMNYKLKEKSIEIKTLDDLYNIELIKDKDIRNLSLEYNEESAKNDNNVILGIKPENINLYNDFMNNYKNKTTAFLRIAQSTYEGDIIIFDIIYYSKTDKVYFVLDNRRDRYINESNKTIELKEYNHFGEYEYKNDSYLVFYNEEITDDNFNTNNVFSILKTNW